MNRKLPCKNSLEESRDRVSRADEEENDEDMSNKQSTLTGDNFISNSFQVSNGKYTHISNR